MNHVVTIFHSVVSKFLYASNNTRPDLPVSISTLCSFTSKPTAEHHKTLLTVFRYIKGTLEHGITLGGTGKVSILLGHSDSDWASDLHSRKSRTGYIFFPNDGCITWNSKKQARWHFQPLKQNICPYLPQLKNYAGYGNYLKN